MSTTELVAILLDADKSATVDDDTVAEPFPPLTREMVEGMDDMAGLTGDIR